MKYRLWDMSWKEAEETFKKSDTVILPTGTLHGHGPTPISIDSSSVEKLADEVGKRTGLMVLPVVAYGDNEKMFRYPGSIAIRASVLEAYYTDICQSLYRNGVRKVIVLNGHGGNREALIRTGRNVRELGMMLAILEWWRFKPSMPDLFPDPHCFKEELAVGVAIAGKEVADLRKGGYRGEWGWYSYREPLGDKIKPQGFDEFSFKNAPVLVPIDAWDIDIDNPPDISKEELDKLYEKGKEIIRRSADHIAEFAREFEKVNPSKVLKS